MNSRPSWFHQLVDIRRQVAAADKDALWDRGRIGLLFDVERTQATALMLKMGAAKIGTSLCVTTAQIADALDRYIDMGTLEDVEREGRRRARLANIASRPAGATAADPARRPRTALGTLPDGIDIEPGEVRIRFDGANEFFDKMACLLTAWKRDKTAFENLLR